MVEDGSKSRLRAILGVDISEATNESLALAKDSQNKINKDNGGKEVFCNIKYHRDGLQVKLIDVKVEEMAD